jgi:general secretion pathway protein G
MIRQNVRLHLALVLELIAMLAATTIVVLFAALAPPTVMSRLERAKKEKACVECKTLVSQAKMFRLKHGDYPATLAELAQRGADGSAPFIEARWLIDPWGHEYQYALGRHPGVSDPEVWSMGSRNDPSSIVGSWQ